MDKPTPPSATTAPAPAAPTVTAAELAQAVVNAKYAGQMVALRSVIQFMERMIAESFGLDDMVEQYRLSYEDNRAQDPTLPPYNEAVARQDMEERRAVFIAFLTGMAAATRAGQYLDAPERHEVTDKHGAKWVVRKVAG